MSIIALGHFCPCNTPAKQHLEVHSYRTILTLKILQEIPYKILCGKGPVRHLGREVW